jgi:N-acetylated-alpha-linked acidic dipeptidase
MEDTVRARAVAYVNEEDLATGPRFEGAASPSLKPFLRQVTQAVPDPEGKGSVYDAWLAHAAGDSSALELSNFGGGSDFAPFTHHVGVVALAAGFSGPTGVYHSTYDSYDWMSRFGDPGYLEHRAAAQLACVAVSRLANARVLPLDYVAFGNELIGLLAGLDSGLSARHWPIATTGVNDALARFIAAARGFARVRDSVGAAPAAITPARAATVNHWLLQVERRLTRPDGLVGRPWYRSLEFASDPDNGYSTIAFPSVAEAIRYADAETTERELADLVAHVDAAREAIEHATDALR